MKVLYYLTAVFLLGPYHHIGICQVFRSMVDMEELIHTEGELINILDKYSQTETQKLDLLSRYLQKYEEEHIKCLKNIDNCVKDPFDAYYLIKRLTSDWEGIKMTVKNNNSQELLSNVSELHLPTSEDIIGVRQALIRLQSTYKFNITAFTNGEIDDLKTQAKLTALDCIGIGKQGLDDQHFENAETWLQEAYTKLDQNINSFQEKVLILDHLAFAAYKQGNISIALDYINKLLNISPNYQKALTDKKYYEDVKNNISNNNTNETNYYCEECDPHLRTHKDVVRLMNLYKQTCRKERTVSAVVASKLKCKYVNKSNPFLYIAPFKLEEINIDPLIILYHDVLSNNEIELIMKISSKEFSQATVIDSSSGNLTFSNKRIGTVAWITEKNHEHLNVINRRVSHMTGLDVTSSEPLQVSNYGIGGHFDPHLDAFRKQDYLRTPRLFDQGNRIATLLFYFGDFQGGLTVFPYINVTIHSTKGSAALWYNLRLNGETDVNTAHAACPVINGSKWVMTKWLLEFKQEFLRPCGLKFDEFDRRYD